MDAKKKDAGAAGAGVGEQIGGSGAGASGPVVEAGGYETGKGCLTLGGLALALVGLAVLVMWLFMERPG